MDYIVKDVGKPQRNVSSNEVIGIYGTKLSISLFEKGFVTQATIMDDIGRVRTTITKKDED